MERCYPGVHIEEVATSPAPIEGAPTSDAAVVGGFPRGPVERACEVRSSGRLDELFGDGGDRVPEALGAARAFFQNGGQRCVVVRARSSAGPHLVVALEALDRVRGIGLLSIPDVVSLADTDAAPVILAAQRWCARRRAFLLVDPPQREGDRDDPSALLHWLRAHPELRSSDAAIYVPRLVSQGGLRPSASSGAVAGVFARTDRARGVWKAPAGRDAELRGGVGPARPLDEREIEDLRALGANAIRRIDGAAVLWGARTMGEGQWRYVPVRRLALFLEESIDRGTEWAVFEPNDERLWSRLRSAVEALLQQLFRAGAFAGATPDESWFVRCGRDTMTEGDLDRGRVIITVGFAPTRPAEFVILRISHEAARGEGPEAAARRLISRIRDSVTVRRGVTIVVRAGEPSGRRSAAATLAEGLRAPLYRVDLSEVVSGYIGETEKNLSEILRSAGRRGAILWFDEADALFGRRTDARDAHDRYANAAVAYVLRRIERHPGIVVLAVTQERGRRRSRRRTFVLDLGERGSRRRQQGPPAR